MMKTKNVILMMDNARSPDRGFIRGLVDYLHQRGSWAFYRISPLYLIHPFFPGRKENIIDYLTKGDADGFFGYLPEQKDIQQIITAGFPAVIVPVKKPGIIWGDYGVFPRITGVIKDGFSGLSFCFLCRF